MISPVYIKAKKLQFWKENWSNETFLLLFIQDWVQKQKNEEENRYILFFFVGDLE